MGGERGEGGSSGGGGREGGTSCLSPGLLPCQSLNLTPFDAAKLEQMEQKRRLKTPSHGNGAKLFSTLLKRSRSRRRADHGDASTAPSGRHSSPRLLQVAPSAPMPPTLPPQLYSYPETPCFPPQPGCVPARGAALPVE